ncbi:MAG: 3-oxoacyl-[acyl-carrier-protein] reductase [Planctomycetota bacterium]|jgi:3-oxoacyl-[acyl-carrier protein] reductase|nr:3-oxoacyl-[acyl-carrier-protein] reductase [Planctomycetota bacterium]MDP7253629.1 3-oxoacyl-[acyl-carrier-protein] reductase [Planctomycetota bacterium]
MSLTDKIAIVTGASRGIGRAIAIRLSKEGALVCGLARNEEALAETARLASEAGGEIQTYPCDISDTDSVAGLFKNIIKEHSGAHILVNNAGITRDNLLMRMKADEWDTVLQTNLKGAFNTTQGVMRQMVKQKYGRIINITSVVGIIGQPGQSNYAASKAGLIGFTKSLAKELASRNITVNAVAPGFITTDMTEELSEELKNDATGAIPLGRFGQPEEIADAVAFLASDNAGYITGHVLQVDGGIAM